MKTIVVQNQKGGVGKTATSLLLLNKLNEMGRDVVFIDNDPQCSASQWLDLQMIHGRSSKEKEQYYAAKENGNLYRLMHDFCDLEECLFSIPETTVRFIPTIEQYEKSKTDFRDQPGHENMFHRKLRDIDTEFLIIDTPGEMSLLTNWSLSIADVVIIPVQTAYFSFESLPLLIKRIRTAQKYLNENLKKIILVPNMVDLRLRASQTVMSLLIERYGSNLIFLNGEEMPVHFVKRQAVENFMAGEEWRCPEIDENLEIIIGSLL